jgi:predicted small lipoprotein YifL
MGIVRRWSALPTLVALTGCGVVAPLYDPGMRRAPRTACAEVAPAPDRPQCFRFERRRIGGERLEMNDGTLDGETELIAFLTGGPGCAGGDLHYAAVSGAASAPGQLQVLAFAGTSAQRGHDFSWDQPFAARSFAYSGVGGPFVNATGIRLRAPQGFRVQRVCLADYWREDIVPLRASRRRP